MRQRLDPWPSIADLFSSLLVASFAGLVLFTALQGVGGVIEDKVHTEARQLKSTVLGALQKHLGGSARDCGTEDICLDIDIQFPNNSDMIEPAYRRRIAQACAALQQALGSLKQGLRGELEIIIEGHTDPRQATGIKDPRRAYLHNWNLSSYRANSVLYEFSRCGLGPPEDRIQAVGYADSLRLCLEDTPECNARNRRTTFRLRADTRRIRQRLYGF
ncbi:MAG: OmpA family protein [Bryobacterales bacterium]|nr:OmpA family protein [Bryobacterales bacterium]